MKEVLKAIIGPRFWAASKEVISNLFDLYAKKSYSQEGEDMILRRIFENENTGFYVDIGAHHPKRFSNTYYFYKRGWSGINVDAMPDSMKRFNKIRPRDINIEAAVSNEKKEITYYMFNEPALNSFDIDLVQERINEKYNVIKEQKIITETLKEILGEYLPRNQKINFMDVDVEGLDLEVLKSNDFSLFRPEYILVESTDVKMSDIQNNEIYKFLRENKYELFGKTVLTLIFKDFEC